MKSPESPPNPLKPAALGVLLTAYFVFHDSANKACSPRTEVEAMSMPPYSLLGSFLEDLLWFLVIFFQEKWTH